MAIYTSVKVSKESIIKPESFKLCVTYFGWYKKDIYGAYTVNNPRRTLKTGAKLKKR